MSVNVSCADCAVEFCLTPALYARRRQDGAAFYCPNGHSNVYRPTADQETIAKLEKRIERDLRDYENLCARFNETYAQREELIGALKECPGGCGWRSRKQIPRDGVAMGRGLERVRLDIAAHLVEAHGARPTATKALPART